MSLIAITLLAVSCSADPERESWKRGDDGALPSRGVALPPSYEVSPRGGMAATGPGARYNHCERIWCLEHGENFHIDHFLRGHNGWILHDDAAGDVYSSAGRSKGPKFPSAKSTVLRLCGLHAHPFLLGIGRGFGPVHGGHYATSVGYSRAHWRAFGTQIDACCTNGMGWDYVHSSGVGRFFRFHDLDEYRAHPERGWQKPFTSAPIAEAR